jgi:hypothetical protein
MPAMARTISDRRVAPILLIMDLICVRVVLMDVPRALAISAASLPAAIASAISASALVRP